MTQKLDQRTVTPFSHRIRVLQRWGIPVPEKDDPIELTLMDRLVFVRYREKYWWPAILYKSNQEMMEQQSILLQVSDELPGCKLMGSCSASPLQMRRKDDRYQVARLLGRPSLDIVQIKHPGRELTEFYWQLSQLIPKTLDSMYFRDDLDLYYDWHRSLDQVEQLLRDCFGRKFEATLSQGSSKRTWLQRAKNVEKERWSTDTICGACYTCGGADQVLDDDNDIMSIADDDIILEEDEDVVEIKLSKSHA